MNSLDQIELKTRDLLEEIIGDIEFIEPPINLGKILEYFNIKLAQTLFKDPHIAGAFDKKEKMIYFSQQDSPKRQFFTAAHELGHFVLHPQKKEDIFYRYQASEFNGESAEEEKQANYFAACLLMPRELVQRFWDTQHDLELLAASFGVSRSAAYWRLKNLRLI